jgi:hypothetical protein
LSLPHASFKGVLPIDSRRKIPSIAAGSGAKGRAGFEFRRSDHKQEFLALTPIGIGE